MKTILIEEVSNGWIVRNHDPFSLNPSYKPGEIHVFQSIEELQNALPDLLAPINERHATCPTPEEIARTPLEKGLLKHPRAFQR